MKDRVKLFGVLGLIWLIFFEAGRVVFLIYQFTLTRELDFYEIAMPLLLGLRMDLAMAAYWLIIPGLTLVASFFIAEKITAWVITITIYTLSAFSCLVVVADLELYSHWGFRMDTTPLMYAGSEGIGSVSIGVILGLAVIFILLILALHIAFQKYVWPRLLFPKGNLKSGLLLFLMVCCLAIPIRSSFRVAPLNVGVVYFHKTKAFPNHAGINVVWNFMRSLVANNALRYPTHFLDAETTQNAFHDLMRPSDSTVHVLRQGKPNILLIILESYTAKIIEPLGGLPAITPNLNKLSQEGTLFTNFYSSGDRTDKGLIAILSGYPAQPKTSIIKFSNKTQSLPALPNVLNRNGYHTSFTYGGDIGFANMESYLKMAGFSYLTEDDDFDLSLNISKWGVHDQYVLDRVLQELDTAQVPFFKTVLTLSSHEPFEVPFGKIDRSSREAMFLNAASYTDSCLGSFIQAARKKSWWENTWVIITADHGHRHPRNSPPADVIKYKIPMLWLGGVIMSTGQIDKIGSQTDIINTLLKQLKIDSRDFVFGKDLLSPDTKSFAVFSFNNGFGYVDPTGQAVYDFDYRRYVSGDSALTKNDLNKGKAFMQMLFNDYNKR
jgi:phosphoglycerol transferase MdoB-like AlkP superfamily enzyme